MLKKPILVLSILQTLAAFHPVTAQTTIETTVAKIIDSTDDNSTRVLKIYTWIGRNIGYSLGTYNRSDNTTWQSAATVLENGRAVCIGFANLFREMCAAAGIEAVVVEGFTDGSGSQHAWNAVEIDGSWYLADVTWDAENIKSGAPWRYYLTNPEVFSGAHYPHDPMWQLSFDPLTFTEFRKNTRQKTVSQPFIYFDSLSIWQKMEETEKQFTSLRRSMAFHPDNPYVVKDLANFYFEKALLDYHRLQSPDVDSFLEEDPEEALRARIEHTKNLLLMAKELFERVIVLENLSAMTDARINLALINENLEFLNR